MNAGHVGRLRADLGLDTTRFSAGLLRARAQTQSVSASMATALRGMSGAVLGLAGVPLTMGATVAAMRAAVSSMSELGKRARATGLDVEDLQGILRGMARSTILSQEQISQGLEIFTSNVGEAINGTGPLVEMFDRLGISVRDASGEVRSQRDLLDEVADAIRRARNESERAAIARAAFGASGRQMADALAAGPQALRAMISEARAAGDVIDRNLILRAEILDDKWDAVTRRVKTFFQELTMRALGFAAETPVDTLTRLFGTIERAQAVLGAEVFRELIAGTAELDAAIVTTTESIINLYDGFERDIARAMNGVIDVTGQLSDLGRVADMISFDDAIAEIEVLASRLSDGEITASEFGTAIADALTEADRLLTEFAAIDGVDVSAARREIDALRTSLGLAAQDARALRAELPGGLDMTMGTPLENAVMPADVLGGRRSQAPRRAPNMLELPPPDSAGGGAAVREGYAAAVADIRDRTAALLAEAAALAEVAASGIDYGDAVEYARVRAELLTAALASGRADTPALRAEIDELAQAYVRATADVDALAEAMRAQQMAGERGASALTDLFTAAAQGGDAARQAVIRLIAELARVQMMRGFSLLASRGGGVGRFVGGLGNLLTGKRAAGGPVTAGAAYLVNENTRDSEVFVAPRNGAILNVAQAQAALRGGQGGTSRVELMLSPDLEARILDRAGQQSIAISTSTARAAATAQDAALLGRMRSLDQRGR